MFDLFDRASESDTSASSPADSPAKTFRWLDDVLALLESGADCGGNSIGSSGNSLPPGFSSKTSLDYCRQTMGPTLPSSFEGWRNWGMGGPTGWLTLNGGESPKDADVCSLSDILEDAPTVPLKYYLSAKACRGILRRAEKRGKELPPLLRQALQAVAESVGQDDGGKMMKTLR